MTTPGSTPPSDVRWGRVGALRDNYRKAKAPKPESGEKRPWYKRIWPAKP
jgi:hypothetical protein